MKTSDVPADGGGRGVWGVEGEASGLRPTVLQDHGRGDARQGPEHEEDSQAAADLLQVQKLTNRKDEEGYRLEETAGLYLFLFCTFCTLQ